MFYKGFTLDILNYDLLGGYVNSFVIETAHNIFVIDGNVGSARADMQRLLDSKPVKEKPVTLLCTHGHWDHVGLAAWMRDHYGAKVMAPSASVPFMQDKIYQLNDMYDHFVSEEAFSTGIRTIYMNEFPAAIKTNLFVEAGDVIEDDDFRLKVYATPGHWGDCITFFEEGSRLAFCGDALQGRGFDGNAPFYTDAEAYKNSAELIRSLNPMSLFMGHGIVMGPKSCNQFIDLSMDFFNDAAEFIRTSDDALSLKQLTADFFEKFDYAPGIHGYYTLFAHLLAEKPAVAAAMDVKLEEGRKKADLIDARRISDDIELIYQLQTGGW